MSLQDDSKVVSIYKMQATLQKKIWSLSLFKE